MSTLLGNRYQILDKLGEGSMGAVYRAIDRLSDENVALKRVTVPTKQLEFASLATIGSDDPTGLSHALAVEFKTLASLRHPHIISVLDYGFEVTETEHIPYFTMELLNESHHILEAGNHQPIDGQIDLIIQVLQALAYLYRHDILHRDLKPGNILVTPDGTVKVLDFGLSTRRDHVTGTAGTIAYMAPEVLRGRPANHVADLYAVGLIAYQLIVGDYPFDRASPSNLISNIIYKMPEVSSINHVELQQVFSRWLTKDPAERFQSTDDIIAALSSAIGKPPLTESIAIRESFLQSAQFVGRETERQTLLTALQQAIEGHGSAILIGGESGIGKSRLLDEIRIQAMIDGVLVLHGQSVEGGGLPFQLWRTILPRLILTVDPTDVEVGVLKEIVPDIDRLLARQIPPVARLLGEEGQQRLVDTMVQILNRYTEPVVLLLEDLQWANRSLLPLKPLTAKTAIQQRPMLIVASYRDDERPDLRDDLPDMHHITLKRMSDREIAALSTSMLGEKGTHPNLLDLLHKETEGNAFFLVEVVRTLAEAAGQLQDIGVATLPRSVFAGGIQQIIQRRLDRVPSTDRPLLKLAAVAGRQLDSKLMKRLATQPIDEWLLTCAAAAVLDVHEGTWRFAHDKLRESLLATLDDEQRPQLHRQVAEALEAEYPDNDDYATILLEHWYAVGDVERTAPYAHTVIGNAMMLSNWLHGAAIADRMLNLVQKFPSEDADLHRMRFLYTKAEAARQTADYDTAHALLPQVLDLAEKLNDNDVLAEVYTSYGDIAGRLSDHESAVNYIERGLAIHRKTGNTYGIAESINELGVVAWGRGQFQVAGSYFEEALALFNSLEDQERIAALLGNMAAVKTIEGHIDEARVLVDEALAINIKLGVTWGIASSYDTLGSLFMYQGDYETALDHMHQAMDCYEQCSEFGSMPEVFASMSRAALLNHDHEQAHRYAQESLGWTERLNDQWGRANALHALGSALFAADHLQDARQHLAESVQIRRNTGQESKAATLAELARVEASLGNRDTAHRHILEAVTAAQNEHLIRTRIEVIMAAIHIALMDGHTENAHLWIAVVHHHPKIGADQRSILRQIISHFHINPDAMSRPTTQANLNQTLQAIANHFTSQSTR